MGHVEAHTKEPKKRVGGRPIVYHVTLSSEDASFCDSGCEFLGRSRDPQGPR
jgi:hypothetical protein